MKKTILLFALLLTAIAFAFGQTSNVKQVYPNPANMLSSYGQYLVQTADGGFLLSGTTSNPNQGSYAIPRLIKLDAALQVSWDKTYLEQPPPHGMTASLNSPALQTADGGYAFVVRNDSTATDFLRLDANGNVLWEKDLTNYAYHLQLLGVLSDGRFLLTVKTSPYTLFHLDANGNILNQTVLVNNASNGAISSILLSNNDVLTAYQTAGTKTIFQRNDMDGNLIWQTLPNPVPQWVNNLGAPKMAAMPDGGFVITGFDGTISNNRLYRFDALGTLIWTSSDQAIPNTMLLTDIAVTASGQFVLSGHTVTNRGFVAQMNAASDGIEWSAESPIDGQEHLNDLNAIPTSDGWGAGVGITSGDKFGFMKVGDNSGISVNVLTGRVAKDDDDNCQVDVSESGLVHARIIADSGQETFGGFSTGNGNYLINLPAGNFTLSVVANEPFFTLCPTTNTAVSFPAGSNGSDSRDLPMQSPDLIHEISGEIHLDANSNCTTDPAEDALQNWRVEIQTTTGNLHLKTNASGQYKAFVPDGSYTLYATPYNNNFSICSPATQNINLVGPAPQLATVDFVASPDFLCGRMRAELGVSQMRPCTTSTVYAYYRNDGTVLVNGASMTVTLDPLLTYNGASTVPTNIDGQKISFDLGNVQASPGSDWAFIKIYVSTDCDLAIGDQVCVSSKVFPDEDCTQEQNWSGAIVSVFGECDSEDRAIFSIKNVGNAPNAQILNYIITEDQIVLRQGTFQLNPGEEKLDTLPGNGLPFTIIAQQEPGYPGDTSVVWNIVNCGGTGGGMSSGFGGSSGPFTHQECFTVSNSFDPNDKTAIPLGSGPAHFVHPGTPLEYHIRFQNTGNDTAFLVVIRDTLSKHFDFGKIEPRGSSNLYEFAQINDSIVQFTFRNILLPDSTTNPEGSQGFVDFSIYPKKDLADGTAVFNKAAIYFDFNKPIITNAVKRIYGKYVTVKINEPVGAAFVPVKVYPNPFMAEATFELPENTYTGDHLLTLMDASGRSLRQIYFEGNKCTLRRGDLPQGIIAWTISTHGKVISSGTCVAH